MARIAGRVVGVENPGALRIVVFAHTDTWYVQPYVAAPHTRIEADGTWSTATHLGNEYAVLLVNPRTTERHHPAVPDTGDDVRGRRARGRRR